MKYAVLLILFFTTGITNAQIGQFTLHQAAPMNNNPAYTGTAELARVNYGFNVSVPTTSFIDIQNYLSYDQHIDALKGGIGIEIYQRNFAEDLFTIKGLAVNYAYQKDIKDIWTLSLGTGISFRNVRENTINPNIGEINVRSNWIQARFGAALYTEKFYFDINYNNTFSPNNALVTFNDKHINSIKLTTGFKINPFSNNNLSLLPSITYQNQNKFENVQLQLMFQTNKLSLGASIEFKDAYSLIVGYQFGNFQLKSAVSFQQSPLLSKGINQFELILQYRFNKMRNNSVRPFQFNLF